MIADTIETLSDKWWTFLLRGLAAIGLAVFAFTAPAAMMIGLVYIVAAFFIISGLLALLGGISLTGVGNWWLSILLGIGQGLIGVIMLSLPVVGPITLAYMVAIWAFSTGLMEIASAVSLRDVITNEFWWILLGLVTLGFGVYVIYRPDLGLLALVYTIGIYAAIAGVSLIAFAFRIKGTAQDVRKLRSAA